MNQLDTLYRAFLDYRKNTLEDRSCRKLRSTTRKASADKDKVEAIRSHCIIEEDWIKAIEKGLPFVEKAIREERQFIRQEGNITPIEKVRRVSKDSVEHLARHGNLITHVPEDPDDDVIPDSLYVVENLSNYAVYENRFLYMLLCYLRDFIDLRYQKIVELGNTYKANMTMAKTINIGKRDIKYTVDFAEEAKNDPYSTTDDETTSMMGRIEAMQNVVTILLNTPLMREVSHAPMLKPPITRTNALRMDNALRHALALYDYIATYDKDGYQVEVIKKTFSPFPDTMGDEFSELVVMTSFLVYEYGNNLKDALRESYDEEEKRRALEASNRLQSRIRELKSRLAMSGQSPEEYMLLLEERNAFLEEHVMDLGMQLEEAMTKIASLNQRVDELLAVQEHLNDIISDLEFQIRLHEAEMEELRQRHAREIAALKEAHQAELAAAEQRRLRELAAAEERRLRELAEAEAVRVATCEDYEQRLHKQKTELDERYDSTVERYESEITVMKDAHEATVADMEAAHEAEVTELKDNHAAEIARMEEEHAYVMTGIKDEHEAKIEQLETDLRESRGECEELKDKNLLLRAQLHGIRSQHGLLTDEDDFTSEERYEELLTEMVALDAMVAQQWRRAKKRIRHEYLWKKRD